MNIMNQDIYHLRHYQNESGQLSSETLSNIINDGLLEYLSYENGQLIGNTSELYNNAEAKRISASQALYKAMSDDVMAVAEGKVKEASELAQTAVANLGDNAEIAANKALIQYLAESGE